MLPEVHFHHRQQRSIKHVHLGLVVGTDAVDTKTRLTLLLTEILMREERRNTQ